LNKQRPPRPKPRQLLRTATTKPITELKVEIELRSVRAADTIYFSLLPETKQPPGFRSQIRVRKKGRIVALRIVAQDLVALRAATNTFIRFVSVASKTIDSLAPFYRAVSPD
jgi:tRNA threonylcarbamoyladenosine modification (KEOPS) complex  Pcc1 subunit